MIEGWGEGGEEEGSKGLECVLREEEVRDGRIDSPIMSESSDPCHSAEAPTRMASRIARAITPIAQSNTVMRGHIESWRGNGGLAGRSRE